MILSLDRNHSVEDFLVILSLDRNHSVEDFLGILSLDRNHSDPLVQGQIEVEVVGR